MLHQNIFVTPVLAMPNMQRNEDIEALAGCRNVAMHWGDPNQLVDHLVQLAIDRKVHVTPTPASIAAQVQLVEPGLVLPPGMVLPRQAPAGLDAQELHIHVEHLHIHVPQGGLSVAGGEGETSTQPQPPVNLVEDGGQETPGGPTPTRSSFGHPISVDLAPVVRETARRLTLNSRTMNLAASPHLVHGEPPPTHANQDKVGGLDPRGQLVT